jgi:hypothetical protein
MDTTQPHFTEGSSASILTFSWADPGFIDLPFGLQQAIFALGDATDPHHATLVVTKFSPGAELPAHSHDSVFCDAVVEGSMIVGGQANPKGTIRLVPSKVGYGPSIAGPEGCTLLEFYADDTGRPANLDQDSLSDEFKAELAEFWARTRTVQAGRR